MEKQNRQPGKYERYMWVLGFLGFMGFQYFYTHEVASLFFFSFFASFSYWFTARLAAEMPDERYMENQTKARATTMFVPAIALFAIGFGVAAFAAPIEVVVLIAAFGWAATFITYAVAFWYYEKH